MNFDGLLIGYCLVVPLFLSLLTVLVYTMSAGLSSILLQGPNRGDFLNVVATRWAIELIAVLVFIGIIVAVLNVPSLLMMPEAAASLHGSSAAFKGFLNGISVIVPTFALLWVRGRFLSGWRENSGR